MASTEAQRRPRKSIPVRKREIFGWAMYDFANSSYTTVVISLVYSAFFTSYIVEEGSELRDTYYAFAIVASTLLAIVLSPLVGAICDYSGKKKQYLAYTTVICAVSTAALFFVGPGDVWLAIALLTLSNAAFMIGEAFVASFLPDLATKKTMGIISGLGWGLGYFGGLASLAVVLFLIVSLEAPAAEVVRDHQWAMIFVGVFFFVSALPTFLLVRERSVPVAGYESASFGKLLRAGVAELRDTYQLARAHPVLFRFLLAFMVYMAGLEVVIKFIGIYTNQELALTQGDLTILFIILQLSAAAGALAFGFIEAKVGAKKTVLATIVWWICGILAIFFLDPLASLLDMTPARVFFGIAVIAGAGIGSIQSSSRAVVGLLAPPDRSAQMFGFWGMFMRLAIILGMTFGPLSDLIGSRRHALLLVVAFFAIGGLMLLFVPVDEAVAANEDVDRVGV